MAFVSTANGYADVAAVMIPILISLVALAAIEALFLFYAKRADVEFLSDCEKLWKVINKNPGQIDSAIEMSSLARTALVGRAKMMLVHQHHQPKAGADEERIAKWHDELRDLKDGFKRSHLIALRFGLVENKWNLYFDEARAQLANEWGSLADPA